MQHPVVKNEKNSATNYFLKIYTRGWTN